MDFNSRTKIKPYYTVHNSVSLLSYSNDNQLTEQINQDVGHNEYFPSARPHTCTM